MKLSLISDDALVANSAEIPLEYHTDPSRPFTSSRPRDEESELPELADKLVVQVGASCPRRPVATRYVGYIMIPILIHILRSMMPKF